MKMIIHQANGLNIGQRREDGYINATALSKAHYKATKIRRDTNHWLALERTKKTIEHLSRLTEISVDQLVIKVKTGRNEYRGTYIHPRLAVRFGIWLSDDFGYMVEEWVNQWMTTGQNPIQTSQTAQNLTPENKPQVLKLLSELKRQINHARLFRHTAHNITDQPIISKNINRVVHRAMHEQGSILNDCLDMLDNLRELIEREVAETPVQQPVTVELPVIEPRQVSESEPKPHYQTFIRKEARLTNYQLEQLTILARKLNRQRKGKGERITENTLIRVAVDLLLNNPHELDNLSFIELPESHFVLDNQPTYLSFNRKETRLTEEQLDLLTKLARKLNRQKQGGDRITENTLIRSAVDLLLNQSERLKSKLQVI